MSSHSRSPDPVDAVLSADERAALLTPYEHLHDYRGVDLAPFPTYWVNYDPIGFQRLKQHLPTLWESVDGEAMPLIVGQVLYAFGYMMVGNANGALYEVIGSRRAGLSRVQVIELARHAALAGGPRGVNPIAEALSEYLEGWASDGDAEPDPSLWPSSWTFEPEVFRSGIDHDSAELSPAEWSLLESWYERMLGGVPPHFAPLATWHPTAFKTMRIREEHAAAGTLPNQLIPLLHLHAAMTRRDPVALRRAVALAKSVGVRRHELVCAIYWSSVPGGEPAVQFAYATAGEEISSFS
jgi:hypothetical protein